MQLGDVIDKLYASEINCAVRTMWDAGYLVQMGDDLNGFQAETTVKSSAEAAEWLDAEARRRYPNSVYAGGKGYGTREAENGHQ